MGWRRRRGRSRWCGGRVGGVCEVWDGGRLMMVGRFGMRTVSIAFLIMMDWT